MVDHGSNSWSWSQLLVMVPMVGRDSNGRSWFQWLVMVPIVDRFPIGWSLFHSSVMVPLADIGFQWLIHPFTPSLCVYLFLSRIGLSTRVSFMPRRVSSK